LQLARRRHPDTGSAAIIPGRTARASLKQESSSMVSLGALIIPGRNARASLLPARHLDAARRRDAGGAAGLRPSGPV